MLTAAPTAEEQAFSLLRTMLGPSAAFRDGQWSAIRTMFQERGRLLVVQKTGWGKSIVYFIATRMLRDAGAGPTLLISPLLSLMRNQLDMAQRLGIRALSINSTNAEKWDAVEDALRDDECDLLMVSPERLANERFQSATLRLMRRGIGLFVVDEAHCISDWGHDFRPDYRRILAVLRCLPDRMPVLATTATANNRVIDDVLQQFGPKLALIRGPMRRHSLRLQNIELPRAEERLAWLAEHVPRMSGSGIIYCLTIDDCERVSGWLRERGIDAASYHANLEDEQRGALERRLLHNKVKALVATVALGMGFDKPDLGFVVHYQRPGSVIAYYQQIGRAGRAIANADAVLLFGGEEDDRIVEYFIESAFPSADETRAVLKLLESCSGLRWGELVQRVDISRVRLEKLLRLLEVEGAVGREKGVVFRTVTAWTFDDQRIAHITAQRRHELQRMRDYTYTRRCLWEFLQRELDDPRTEPCGHCSICSPAKFSTAVDHRLEAQAAEYLRKDYRIIEPRLSWPSGGAEGWSGRIKPELRVSEGRALCRYGDDGWGTQVRVGKYTAQRFCEPLVRAAAELVRELWRPEPFPEWVTCVPSRRNPMLVRDLAERIATELRLPFRSALVKVKDTPEQKLLHNSAHQVQNLAGAVQVATAEVHAGPVLLVDDMVDSRWTMTVCGVLLRQAGVEVVYPFALADSRGSGDAS
jgi:ATP-dependent DNA helicase RecQ